MEYREQFEFDNRKWLVRWDGVFTYKSSFGDKWDSVDKALASTSIRQDFKDLLTEACQAIHEKRVIRAKSLFQA